MSEHALYQARAVFASLAARMCDDDTQVPDDIASLVDMLGNEAAQPMEILRRVICAKLDADAMATATGERIKTMQDRKARHDRRSEALRTAAFAAMDAIGMTKLVDPEFTVSIIAGRTSVMVADEAEVPDEYWKTTRAIDKAAINEATKQGIVIPGVLVGNAIPSLSIRSK